MWIFALFLNSLDELKFYILKKLFMEGSEHNIYTIVCYIEMISEKKIV